LLLFVLLAERSDAICTYVMSCDEAACYGLGLLALQWKCMCNT